MSRTATRPARVVLAVLVLACPRAAIPQDAPQMTAGQKAMMDAWAKASTPGKQHQWLAGKAGRWEFTGRFWMEPGKPPTESKGTAERSMILGGRVMGEKVTSPGFMGQTFEGYGLMGYDNVASEFWGTWTDSMSTGVMLSKGSCDEKGACTMKGQYVDPITGKARTMRSAARDEGPDREVHEAWDLGPDGKEYKSMELVYTRKK